MDKSSKKRRNILILCLILAALIAVVMAFIFYLFYYTDINTTNQLWSEESNYTQAPIISAIVIQPGSYWFYHINYSSMSIVITLQSGNFSAIHPSILDDSNFSLFRQGKPYRYAPETSNITFYERDSYSGDVYAYGLNLVIQNLDNNNTSIMTVTITYQPGRPVPV